MYREFSSETILCFIEMVEFKQSLIANWSIQAKHEAIHKDTILMIETAKTEENMMSSIASLACEYKLYENVPKSSIVYGVEPIDSIEDVKNMVKKLYAKYIKEGSELEVNVTGDLKNNYLILDAAEWRLNIKELIDVFDPVIGEMFDHMLQSFSRFVSESKLPDFSFDDDIVPPDSNLTNLDL